MAGALATRRLPGIAFEAKPPPPARILPRMDIAAFVGFAAAGPINVPVAVEDGGELAAIFGEDAPLAWDAERGEQVRAQLAPAVRAFLRNGGRRAWIVRVAAGSAQRSVLPVPGLVARTAAGDLQHGTLVARSCGSWADELRVGAALSSTPAVLHGVDPATDRLDLELEMGPAPIVAGDLLRVRGDQHELLAFVREVRTAATPPHGGTPAPGRTARRVVCDPGTALWLQRLDPPYGASGTARYVDAVGRERTPRATVPAPLDPPPGDARAPDRVEVDLDVPAALAPLPGTLVKVAGLRGPEPSPMLWLRVDTAGAGEGDTIRVGGTPSWTLDAAPVPRPAFAGGTATVEKLTFELWARRGESERFVIGGLGFSPEHPRYAGDLPTDEAFFALRDAATGPDPQLWSDAGRPRFPLAAQDRSLFYPLGIGVVPDTFQGPLYAPGSPLERDGLHQFGDALFLDRDLRAVGLEALADAADFIRWQSRVPRPLAAIHALHDVDEVTLVAVPDATHRHWTRAAQEWPPVPPPPDDASGSPPASPPCAPEEFVDCSLHALGPVPVLELDPRDQGGSFGLHWSAVDEPGVRYELEEGTDPHGWEHTRIVYEGSGRAIRLYGRISGTHFYRVRGVAGPNVSPWSNGVAVAAADRPDYVLEPESAYQPGVLLAVQRALLRLCAARGDVLAVLSVPEHYRGDAAIAHAQRLRSATDPAPPGPAPAGLDSVRPLEAGEHRALGFGALYHPWLVLSLPERGEPSRRVAPDGTALGVIARRAARRGAWVAPANDAFADVVALVTPAPRETLGALQDAQVNEVRQEPRGFLCLCEDTLVRDEDVRPINVRRLLALLRRLVLHEGSHYVFEPNDPTFRRGVERGLGDVMQLLYTLGAFVGRTPEQAYRVNVADPPNTPQSIDQGRLVVELKIAPSRPLAFLLVRLIHTGERGLELEVP
jgi:hypothetical protein